MLLTKTREAAGGARPRLRRRAGKLPTMDRRAFLRRSGLGVGVGVRSRLRS